VFFLGGTAVSFFLESFFSLQNQGNKAEV